MERFNLKKLNNVEGNEKYHVEVPNRFAALEDLDVMVEINNTWEKIEEAIEISVKESVGCYELRKYKQCLNEECSELLDHRKQAKTQWLQDMCEINVENMNNIIC
jgi:hypothetical protein